MRNAIRIGALLVVLAPGFHAWGAEEGASEAGLAAREENLSRQWETARTVARQKARVAYRLTRRNELRFVGYPEGRLDDTQTLNAALLALARASTEARAIEKELSTIKDERQWLEPALRAEAPVSNAPAPRFRYPVQGTVVNWPRLRRDPMSGIEQRHLAVSLLARMNQPISAPAAGAVRRVTPLPQGGFAVVIEHRAGFTTITSGLREPDVFEQDLVEAGQKIGTAGRNLDGAPIVSFEVWRGRTPLDPRSLVRGPAPR